jgi:hypothetical protein
MSTNSQSKKSEQGSFLLSTMLSIIMISALLASVWSYISTKQSLWVQARILNSRDLVLTSALRNARVASYYYSTILKNDASNGSFIKCIVDDGLGNDCNSAGGPYPLRLVDVDGATYITGETTNPVLYDIYGQVCSVPSAECPFEISATFVPTCGAAAACAAADTLKVKVQVRVSPSIQAVVTSMATTSASEVVAIADYKKNYFPVLPPTTPYGTPITKGAGVGGYITGAMAPPPPVPVPVPPPAPPPPPTIPPTSTACGAGELQGSGCEVFTF